MKQREITLKGLVTRILLFYVNSVLKLLLSAFTQTAQNTPLELSNNCCRGAPTILVFLVIFAGIALLQVSIHAHPCYP